MLQHHDLPTGRSDRDAPRNDLSTTILETTTRELLAPVWALGLSSSALRRPVDLTDRERALLDEVGVHVHRIARVLASVLDYIQVEREGELLVEPRRCHLEDVCDLAMEALREAGYSGRISYEGVGDGEGDWDPERLAQAISYLVELAAATRFAGDPVAVRWRGDGDEVVVRVEAGRGRPLSRVEPDWGEGAEDAATGGVKGFLARRIALAHAGILARFTADDASAFVMVLPRRPPQP